MKSARGWYAFQPLKVSIQKDRGKFFRMLLNRQGVVPDPENGSLAKVTQTKNRESTAKLSGIVNYSQGLTQGN